MVPVLVAANLLNNRLTGPAGYVIVSITASVLLIALARRGAHCSWDELGLDRNRLHSGLRWGGLLAAITATVLVIGLILPATRPLFEDDRVRALDGWGVLYAAFVRVTFGTVLLEEIAFRSVAPAILATRIRHWQAITVSALLFGLWHILPSMGLHRVNPVADDTVGRFPIWVTVGGSVLTTALLGIWFSFLRERSGSVLTPMLAHWSSNALGYLFAYMVLNWF